MAIIAATTILSVVGTAMFVAGTGSAIYHGGEAVTHKEDVVNNTKDLTIKLNSFHDQYVHILRTTDAISTEVTANLNSTRDNIIELKKKIKQSKDAHVKSIHRLRMYAAMIVWLMVASLMVAKITIEGKPSIESRVELEIANQLQAMGIPPASTETSNA